MTLSQPVTAWDGTTVGAAFRQLERVRPGYTPWVGFVVQHGTAVYTLKPTDRPDLPFTHKLTGNHGPVYGYWTESTGREAPVRRAGWFNTRGVLGTFDAPDTFTVKGYAVTTPQ